MLSGGSYGFSPVTLFAGLSYEVLDKLRYLLTLALNVLLIFILQKHAGIFLSRREMLSFSVTALLCISSALAFRKIFMAGTRHSS